MPRPSFLAAAAVLVLALTGCTADPPPVASGPAPTAVAPPTTSSAPATGCPVTQQVPLTIYFSTASDQETYGSDLVACTDATSENTYFRNDSDTVWVVSQPAGLHWKAAAPTISAEVYREAIIRLGLTVLPVEPGSAATIPAPPSLVRLALDQGLQAAWQAVEAGRESLVDKGTSYVQRALTKGSLSRRALVDCAVEGFTVGKTLAEADPIAGDLTSKLGAGLGLADDLRDPVTTCAKSIQAASQESRRTGTVPALDLQDVRSTVQRSRWTQETENVLTKTIRFIRTAQRLGLRPP